jgi:hypothetical protein
VGVIEAVRVVVAVRDGEVVVEGLVDGDRVIVELTDAVRLVEAVSEGLLVVDGLVLGDAVRVGVREAEGLVERVVVWVGVSLGVCEGVGDGDGGSVMRTMRFTPEYTTLKSVVHCKYALEPVL